MPDLFTLPNELLDRILLQLGTQYFREDVSRLLVCRRWYNTARRLLIETVVLHPLNLVEFMHTERRGLYNGVREETKDLRLSVFSSDNKFGHAQSVFGELDEMFDLSKCYRSDLTSHPILNFGPRDEVRIAASRIVNALPRFIQLESFMLGVSDRGRPVRRYHGEEYPYFHLFRVLDRLSSNLPPTLTTLEISLDGGAFAFNGGSKWHVCPIVAKFLPKLKNLALQLDTTCPEVLEFSESDCPLCLEKLLINLNPGMGPYRHSRGAWNGCREHPTVQSNFFSLQKTRLVEAAKKVAKNMKDPKLVRLLFCIGPNSPDHYVSIDCITGVEMLLPQGARLFEDGNEVENAAYELSSYRTFWDIANK